MASLSPASGWTWLRCHPLAKGQGLIGLKLYCTMGAGASSSKTRHYKCSLNVYNLMDQNSLGGLLGEMSGMRALHTGVEIVECRQQKDGTYKAVGKGYEYAFGSTGVWKQTPKQVPNFENTQATFRETVGMGMFTMSRRELN